MIVVYRACSDRLSQRKLIKQRFRFGMSYSDPSIVTKSVMSKLKKHQNCLLTLNSYLYGDMHFKKSWHTVCTVIWEGIYDFLLQSIEIDCFSRLHNDQSAMYREMFVYTILTIRINLHFNFACTSIYICTEMSLGLTFMRIICESVYFFCKILHIPLLTLHA